MEKKLCQSKNIERGKVTGKIDLNIIKFCVFS